MNGIEMGFGLGLVLLGVWATWKIDVRGLVFVFAGIFMLAMCEALHRAGDSEPMNELKATEGQDDRS